MKSSGNTILITGGGSGIGFQVAKAFSDRGNQVIITGRTETKLARAVRRLSGAAYVVNDVTDEDNVAQLVSRINSEFPQLNILINNAGFANTYLLNSGAGAFEKAKAEMALNYLAPVLLTEKLLPLLLQQPDAAIVNISSIAAYSPNLSLPTYSASKAALHSYSQILRLTLSRYSDLKLFEVFPPWVEAELNADVPPGSMSAEIVAADFIAGFEADDYDIRMGYTKEFYNLFLKSPEKALLLRNGFAPDED